MITRQEGAALVSCLVNLVLTVAKFILFYAFVRSVSLKAEAWHSLSDIGSSFVVFLALYFTRRHQRQAGRAPEREAAEAPPSSGLFSAPSEPKEEATRDEQPSHGPRAKPEDLVAVGIALLFIVVCIGIFIEIFEPQEIDTNYALVVAAGMLVMAYASYLLYKFEYRIGIESDSPGLIADGYHSKIDMYGSLLVASALVAQRLELEEADQIVAAIICLSIFGHAIEVLAMAARHYLGRSLEAAPGHTHTGALADVYALTGRWGETLSAGLTALFARLFFLDRSQPDLGHRVARRLVTVTVLAVAVLYVLSGLFACGPDEQAFVERFGKPTTEMPYGPGLHCCFPWPIDRVVKVRVTQIRELHLGTPLAELNQPILWTNRHYTKEFRFLTADKGYAFLTTHIVVHFRISDLRKFLYECADPVALLENACRAKMREIAATHMVDECLTTLRHRIAESIHAHVQPQVTGAGIDVLAVLVRDIHPPTDVAPYFEEVISSREQKQTLINQADESAVARKRDARAVAHRMKTEADAKKLAAITSANARVSAFNALEAQYAIAREVTAVRLYLESIKAALSGVPKFVILDERGAAALDLWFPRGQGFWRWGIGPDRGKAKP